MRLENTFEVASSPDVMWDVLNDVERIAPYVPGFTLEGGSGDEYRGTMKVKVGAVTVQYNAEIRVVERDAEARRVVMSVNGRETRGPGSVRAEVTSQLQPEDGGTGVSLVTDLQITGRVAQFGRGIIADVSARLVDQFVRSLETEVLAEGAPAAAPPPEPAEGAPAAAASPEPANGVPAGGAASAEAVDITAAAGMSVAKRVVPPVLLAAALALVVLRLIRR